MLAAVNIFVEIGENPIHLCFVDKKSLFTTFFGKFMKKFVKSFWLRGDASFSLNGTSFVVQLNYLRQNHEQTTTGM